MFQGVIMKLMTVAVLSVAVFATGSNQAYADFHKDFLAPIILCEIVGCRKQPAVRKPRPTKPVMSAAQRQQNRDVQSALNAFEFPVGAVDGSLGRKSRAAIGNYQSYMKWTSTGRLDDFQRQTLIENWRKLQYGAGNVYPKMMAQEGTKGLLRTAFDPTYPARFGDRLPGQQPIPDIEVADQDEPKDSLEDFQKLDPPEIRVEKSTSMSAHCELVKLTTTAKGPMLPGNISDPNQALSEKFCDARDFANSNGQFVREKVSVSDREMESICKIMTGNMKGPIGQLVQDTRDNVLRLAFERNAKIGLDDTSTANIYGQICLGMAYRKDDAHMALASALALVASGNAPFGELIGHHLREALGIQANASASQSWFEEAVVALENGAPPAFEPSSTADRINIIREAIEMGSLRAMYLPKPLFVPSSNAVAKQ